jgi:hypothetical protein
MGEPNEVEMVPLYPPTVMFGPMSTQVEPLLVVASSTPPSKPFSMLKLCQKVREEPAVMAMPVVCSRYWSEMLPPSGANALRVPE